MNETPQPHGLPGIGHEPDRPNVRGVVATVAGLVGLVVVSVLLMSALLGWFNRELPAGQSTTLVELPPQPTLGPGVDDDQRRQLQALHAREARQLGGYGWIDEQHSAARIPIERAIEILTRQGFQGPARQEDKP
jgi:hypothetical protein